MKQQLLKAIQIVLIPALFLLLLAGCGDQSVSDTYPLESIVNKDGGQVSRIYRAEKQSVPEVAHQLADQNTPDEISKDDQQHMFLVYSDEWYHIQQDPNKPEDTLIEVDSKEFVRQNYDRSFLEGYILASLLDNVFDSLKHYPGHYRGYTTKDIYKPAVEYHPPTDSERKAAPPITKDGTGTIVKRGSNKKSSGSDYSGTPPSSGNTGKIYKSSSDGSSISGNSYGGYRSPTFTPRSKSPPRTSGGFGKIFKRR